MTLSPSRSLKNLADAKSVNKWYSVYCLNRLVLPLCLVIFSVFIYIAISLRTSKSIELQLQPYIGVTSNANHFTREWLVRQAESINQKPVNVLSRSSDVNMEDIKYIANFLPFDDSDGMNVWDLYPPQISCPDILRLGRVGEGGKWVCGMSHLSAEKECVMYSFGISTDISFEIEILLSTNCVIHAFDPTIGKLPFEGLNKKLVDGLTDSARSRLRFHKIAMNNVTGTTSFHTLNENLLDIMAELKHPFINLLKVDVEGSEWHIFQSLFDGTRHKRGDTAGERTLPIGEILIELHHKTMLETHAFFTGTALHGFLPFSREINLMPCIAGGKPFAVEYSFINADNFFRGTDKFPSVPAPVTPSWHRPIKSVIYFLTQRARLTRMGSILQGLYTNFCKDYPYPVVIFHDDLRPMDQKALQAYTPLMPLTFIAIQFSVPESLVKAGVQIPDRTVCAPDTSTLGYRHMCRFHATGVHTYLKENGFADVEYIMRLDDDSHISYPVGYDLFQYMAVNKKLYGYVNTLLDDKHCITDLWNGTTDFLKSSGIKLKNGTFFYEWPESTVFYNNFEISHSSLWRDPLWLAYMNYVDSHGGIYTLRWGDAPLHTIGVSMILLKSQVHAFTDVSYRHDPFIDQIPRGLPMPHVDPFIALHCTFYGAWVCNLGNATHNMTNANITINSLQQLKDIGNSQWHHRVDHAGPHQLVTAKDEASMPAELGVLYAFGHKDREALLAATISSFHQQFTSTYKYPFVIFHSATGHFDPSLVKSKLSAAAAASVTFVKVTLKEPSSGVNADPYCSAADPEMQAASVFFRAEAAKILRSMKFEWFFRFGDDSSLLQPVHYDVFKRMRREKKRYGFMDMLPGRAECNERLWALGRDMCAVLKKNHELSSAVPECSPFFQEWTSGNTILSNFEVSHYSVWESFVCSNVLEAVGEDPLPVVSTKGGRRLKLRGDKSPSFGQSLLTPLNVSVNWGDAAVHTLCVVTALEKHEVHLFRDIVYHFNWKASMSTKEVDKNMELNRYASSPLPQYDALFAPQRVGWMGGDVAASILLPNEMDLTLPPNKQVWLFGDSFVGVSNAVRRIEEHTKLVANTIGVSTLDDVSAAAAVGTSSPRNVKTMRYYWNTDANQAPAPIFDFSGEKSCEGASVPSAPTFWPLSGVAVAKRGGGRNDVKLVIVGSQMCIPTDLGGSDKAHAASLQYTEHSTVVIVVSNPYDPPDQWRHTHRTVPRNTDEKDFHKWLALSSITSNRFAYEDEAVYLLGLYQTDKRSDITVSSSQTLLRTKGAALLTFSFGEIEILQSSEGSATQTQSTWAPLFVAKESSHQLSKVKPANLFSPVTTEASLHYDFSRGEWLVVNLRVNDEDIRMCRSRSLTSGWVCAFVSHLDPRLKANRELMTYAGKAHPDLLASSSSGSIVITAPVNGDSTSTPVGGAALDGLIISYVSNTMRGPKLMFEPEFREMYAPKFILLQSLTTTATGGNQSTAQ